MDRPFVGVFRATLGLLACAAAFSSCGGANLGTTPTLSSSRTAAGETAGAASVERRSSAVASVTASDAYTNLILSDGVLAFYRLNDSSLATMTALSASSPPPANFNGTYGAHVTLGTRSITTQTGSTAFFHGSGASDEIASVYSNLAFERPSAALSIEAWIKPSSLVTDDFLSIVSYGRGFHVPAWTLEINPQSHLVLALKTAGGTVHSVVGSTTLAVATVYYATATYDGTNAKLYVNGVIDGTLPASGAVDYTDTYPGLALGIGGTVAPAASGVRWSYSGSLEDVGIYASALTPQQIAAHYAAGTTSVASPTPPSPSPPPGSTVGTGQWTFYGPTSSGVSNQGRIVQGPDKALYFGPTGANGLYRLPLGGGALSLIPVPRPTDPNNVYSWSIPWQPCVSGTSVWFADQFQAYGTYTPPTAELPAPPTPNPQEFILGTSQDIREGRDCVATTDGAVWIADNGGTVDGSNDELLRIDKNGTGTYMPLPFKNNVDGLAADGTSVWFITLDGRLGHASASGVSSTLYKTYSATTPLGNPQPAFVAVDNDGIIWLASDNSNASFTLMSRSGQILTSFSEASGYGFVPYTLFIGPDGQMWSAGTGPYLGYLARVGSNGSFLLFPMPYEGPEPSEATTGSDGRIYFTFNYHPGFTNVDGIVGSFIPKY